MKTHTASNLGHAGELAAIDHTIDRLASDSEQAGNLFGAEQIRERRRVGGGPTWHCRGGILRCLPVQYKPVPGRGSSLSPRLGSVSPTRLHDPRGSARPASIRKDSLGGRAFDRSITRRDRTGNAGVFAAICDNGFESNDPAVRLFVRTYQIARPQSELVPVGIAARRHPKGHGGTDGNSGSKRDRPRPAQRPACQARSASIASSYSSRSSSDSSCSASQRAWPSRRYGASIRASASCLSISPRCQAR